MWRECINLWGDWERKRIGCKEELWTKWKKKKIVAVNYTKIPSDFFEADLFGYKFSSFIGAIKDKMGLLQLAEDMAVFFDETGDISLNIQTKLLLIIEITEIRRIRKPIIRRI